MYMYVYERSHPGIYRYRIYLDVIKQTTDSQAGSVLMSHLHSKAISDSDKLCCNLYKQHKLQVTGYVECRICT